MSCNPYTHRHTVQTKTTCSIYSMVRRCWCGRIAFGWNHWDVSYDYRVWLTISEWGLRVCVCAVITITLLENERTTTNTSTAIGSSSMNIPSSLPIFFFFCKWINARVDVFPLYICEMRIRCFAPRCLDKGSRVSFWWNLIECLVSGYSVRPSDQWQHL